MDTILQAPGRLEFIEILGRGVIEFGRFSGREEAERYLAEIRKLIGR